LLRAGERLQSVLRGHLGETEFHRGGIYDLSGNFVAEHEGIEMFTIGQRKGLPGGSPRPRYVVDIDPSTRRVLSATPDCWSRNLKSTGLTGVAARQR
jgi:tRNA-specific 2-thiouridylase